MFCSSHPFNTSLQSSFLYYVIFTWIPRSITFHHAPIQYNTIRTQHDVPGMQPKLKMNCQKERGKSLERRKITIVGLKGLTHSISYNIRTTTCTVLASAAQANTTPMPKPKSVIGQACLSSTVLIVHNILLPAGVISRIALQSLCHRYSDRNVSLSTLKSPSFRALVLLYCCCIDIRTTSNADEYSNTDSHHVDLQTLVYKTAKPRKPTNTTGQQQYSSTSIAA